MFTSSLDFSTLAIFGLPGGGEWIVLLVLGLLIFGRRLPEVGRSIGRSIVEFKRGIKDTEREIEDESSRPASKAAARELPAHSSQYDLPKGASGQKTAAAGQSSEVADLLSAEQDKS